LHTWSFQDIRCTTDPDKIIELVPRDPPPQIPTGVDLDDVRAWLKFVAIPPKNKGDIIFQHEVPCEKIEAANIQKGEKYRVELSDRRLGTRWWSFGSIDELEGVRLRSWQTPEREAQRKREEEEFWDGIASLPLESREQKTEGHWQQVGRTGPHGDEPTSMSEHPSELTFLPQTWEVEFEVV
jgi:hypothetical protein